MGINPHGQKKGVGKGTRQHFQNPGERWSQPEQTTPSASARTLLTRPVQVSLRDGGLSDRQIAQGQSDGICLPRLCQSHLENDRRGKGLEQGAESLEPAVGMAAMLMCRTPKEPLLRTAALVNEQ